MDKTSTDFTPNWDSTVDNFDDLNLADQLIRNIYGYGLDRISQIQSKAIIPILKRKDVIAKSPPETGKTIGYCIALLQMRVIYPEIRKGLALVVSHNEDHVRYIHKILVDLGGELKIDVKICTQVPDELEKETENIQQNFQIIVTTPEAAYDMVKKGHLKMKEVEMIVIDDVDKMIEQGALENVTEILASADNHAQKAMFSSIITPHIISLTERFLEDPAKIVVKDDELTLEGVNQFYIDLKKEEWKNKMLKELLDILDMDQCGIYCNTIQRVIELETWMKDEGMSVACIHEDMEKTQQEQYRNRWKTFAFRILISTGFAPLKNEFTRVNLIILYDLPATKGQYLRLIGRKRTFGRTVVIILVTKDEMESLKETEKYFATKISECPNDISNVYSFEE